MASVTPASTPTRLLDSWKKATEVAKNSHDPSLRQFTRTSWKSLLLFPDDQFLSMWSVLMLLLLIYVVFVTPYRMAFVDQDSDGWVILDLCVNSCFFLDLVFSCVLAYYDEEKNLVTSHKAILIHYLRTWFVPDLCACFPMQLILDVNSNANSILRLAKVSRLSRLTRLFRIVKVAKSRHQIQRYMGQLLLISLAVERLVWFVVMLVVTLHIGACGWVFIGRLNHEFDSENWIMSGGYNDLDNVELYIVAIYWIVTTVATVGYGDIHPVNTDERVFNCFTMLAGVCIYSYMIGALTNLISSLDSRKSKLTQKLELLRQLSRTYGLSSAFTDKLSGAIEYEHRNTNKEIDELVANLPNSLKTQLLTTIHHKKIENNAFFEGKSAPFVAYIAPLLRPYRFEVREVVYKEGDPATEMYFLVTGEVEFILDKENEYVCYVSVSPGYYFGEVDLLFAPSLQRLHTTKTAGRTEVLSFRRDHFEAMLVVFENESLEIVAQAKERSIRIDERRRIAEAEYNANKQVSRHHSVPQDLETRRQHAANMKHTLALEEEDESSSLTIGDETPSANIKLDQFPDPERPVRSAFARLNTFGDTEYTSITQDLVRKKPQARKKKYRSNKDMLRHIQKLQDQVENLTKQLGKRSLEDRSPDVKEVSEEEEDSGEIEAPEATGVTLTPVMSTEDARQL